MRFAPFAISCVLLLAGCRSLSELGDYALAVDRVASQFDGHTAADEFARNEKNGRVVFYATYSHSGESWFPGLTQEEVDRWIVRNGTPYDPVQEIVTPLDVSIGRAPGPSAKSYWKALNDY